ncbi:uncharacterized protein LOC126912610 [Spodoptera frugiperda]|uniref:Uncharacterized protein LOC126912610 n=1 Tax=Spodoptera frugiperda TaxID=7108 RepID=A0A9R0F4G1_SPOFR|nr:uncharacterized protein LOC126912610 [Spodoptera frugiperda]
MLALECDCLRTLVTIYVFNTDYDMSSEIVFSWIVELLMFIAASLLPSVLMERNANDLDDLKAVLSEELLICEDKHLREKIHHVLRYIDACSATYTVWNGFPLNISLTFSFIGVCVLYFIALLQFTF